ncbi:dsDNA nuclease domain-containing protein, partial [Escherichia sp. TWPC-MK]
LLEKQKEKEKYLFLFEYHDDILVLNSSVSPTSAEFIQVNNLSPKRLDMKSLSTRFHRPVRLDLL